LSGCWLNLLKTKNMPDLTPFWSKKPPEIPWRDSLNYERTSHKFLDSDLDYTDEPRQLRLNLEEDWFVYIARMNSNVAHYAEQSVAQRYERGQLNEAEANSLTAIKIGCSRDPAKRAKELSNGAYQVELIMHSYPLNREGAHKIEKTFHEYFDTFRMTEREKQREWFVLTASQIDGIRRQFEIQIEHIQLPIASRCVDGLREVYLPSKCGDGITQKVPPLEWRTYHPFKLFVQGNMESADDINTYNWAQIALGKQTRADHPCNSSESRKEKSNGK
jgi:hypothetical protein